MTIKRTFKASRELVFEMWTKPEHVSKWYGPKGFSVDRCTIDLKPGGEFIVNMKRPDGQVYPTKGIYHVVSSPEKLIFSLISHFDDNGNPQVEMKNTLTFTKENGQTTMVMNIIEVKTIPGVDPLKNLDFAWNQSFDRFVDTLNT